MNIEYEDDFLPTTTVELIKWLDERYPDTIVTRELSPYEQGYINGVINLIRTLKATLKQEKEI